MPATPITNPATGESLVGTEPQLLQQVTPGWRRRLNLFTGRALSDTALDNEQTYRGGLLGTLGQSVSAGTVSGLALTLQSSGADALLVVTPGYGVTANGEDVALHQTLKTRLSTLAVVDAATGIQPQQTAASGGQSVTQQLTLREFMGDPTNTTYAGILVLQPVVAQVSGQMLDTATGPIVVSGNLGASCSQDPAEYAFEDWQIADAVQLVFVPWPTGVPALPLPPQSPEATWRNRLASTIFEAESLLGPDDQLPWAMLGVPVGLIAFDAGVPWKVNAAYTAGQFVMDPNGDRQQVVTAGTTGAAAPGTWNTAYGGNTTDGGVTWMNNGLGWNPLFVDCSSVVRAGGLPRRRFVLPSQPPPLEVWQSNTDFAVGDFIIDGNDNVQTVKTAGTSGGPPPKWNATYGQTTTDGSVVWSNNGPANWQANTAFAAGQFIYDSNGYRQYVTVVGTSGATAPDWSSVYLPTQDGSITWVNNGSGAAPVIQPPLAQSRINQLSEQLSQTLAQGTIKTLADSFVTLSPCGILPAAAMDFTRQRAPWLPLNWSVTAAPVRLEELETALETGMMLAPIPAQAAAPTDTTLMEPVEVLVPLPDALYDPNILVVEAVAPIFEQEVTKALDARNLTLQQMETVQEEVNVLLTGIGPNIPSTPNLIDPDAGLTPQEIAGRNTLPPYIPAPGETFGTVLPTTWAPATAYSIRDCVIDSNGAIQVLTAPGPVTGTSGTTSPTWNTQVGGSTTDGGLTWMNNGPWSWQPNTAYVVGQFIVDANGYRQFVSVAGTSASEPPAWSATQAATTLDGVIWQFGGKAIWQPDTLYAVGDLILDSDNDIQTVQNGGISGDAPPSLWNPNPGQTTPDGGVTWNNLGSAKWQAGTMFSVGQAILDANGNIQTVQVGGTSGAKPPAWNESAGKATTDAAVSWGNGGFIAWQASVQYAAGRIVMDSNGNLQKAQAAGESGTTQPAWSTAPGGSTKDNGVTWICLSFVSTDLQQLRNVVTQSPYVIKYQDSTGASQTLNLLSSDDMALLSGNSNSNGLQTLITSLNARISAANDLLDTAFLTTQTDIYRYRQNVLGASAATTLATSPVLANIATGETATATAANLRNYINALSPATTTTTTTSGSAQASTTTTSPQLFKAATFTTFKEAVVAAPETAAVTSRMQSVRSGAVKANLAALTPASSPAAQVSDKATLLPTQFKESTFNDTAFLGGMTKAPSQVISPAAILEPGKTITANPIDIIGQSPLPGAQLNIRTLTIAERLSQSPSQEAMFYSIANRLSFLQALTTICEDLELAVDDLQILVDNPPASGSPAGSPAQLQTPPYRFLEWRTLSKQTAIQTGIQTPYLPADAPEATLFSVGVRVVEQHSMLLRALEARVQLYSDFVGMCNTALSNMQSDIQQARVYLTHLGNQLQQERQNVAFTEALLSDETTRVASVNAQRQQVLTTTVRLVAYTRARTLEATDTVPSRQLVPANITNPVPACLQQSVSIPPELREIVGQLREAPVSWLPAAASLVSKLQRPNLLQQLALSTQARAALQLKSAVLPSSAAGEPGVYAATISNVYSANQQVFRNLQLQRAAIQPAALTTLSWSLQVTNLQSVAALNDLISSEAVHTEVSNAVARLIQQISSVATCLYSRVSIALPIDRLAWAEYLSGAGVSVGLRSLAILPNWNQQAYTDRQQMQMLVDWLFLQIDTTQTAATAFMSDVVRTAILLASDVPVDNIISGNVIARTQPVVGGIVSLNLPSDRVTSGMYVQLYSGATLAARGVVTDLDSGTVSATVTDVFQNNVYLETTDTAHFTAQTPQAVALRPLFS